jgi:hypothetical protein
VPDSIAAPTSGRPVELVSLAVSDGDLEAALAQYEPGAVLQPWAGDPGGDTGAVADALIGLMDLRLPLSVWIHGRRRATALPRLPASGTWLAPTWTGSGYS